MAKAILQAVGDDTVSFNDQVYWTTEQVKKYLPNFQPGMEVDVTVKDVDGYPMVTFLKKAGFAAPRGPGPQGGYQQQQGNYQQNSYQHRGSPQQTPKQQTVTSPGGSDFGMFALASAIVTAYQLDINVVAQNAQLLKKLVTTPPAPPQQPMQQQMPPQPPQQMAPPAGGYPPQDTM